MSSSQKHPPQAVVRHRHRHNLRNRFELVKTLGQGTYGKVKLAVEKSSGKRYAIKTIRKSKISKPDDLTKIQREIEIMATLGHPHIINVHEVYENAEKIVLVMEFASGGELYDYIDDKKGLEDREARKFFRQIVSAVNYLHQNGIVHRDLKLENIFIDGKGDAKIGDFGLANLFSSEAMLHTFCGSPLYASPEIVNGLPYIGPEVDCWSLGVLLYTLVYGAMPFDSKDFKKLRKQISEGNYFEPARQSEAAGLIRHLLTVNPTKRAAISDICAHWWVNWSYESSPLDAVQPGRPIDLKTLQKSLSLNSSESDSDVTEKHDNKRSSKKPLKSILKNSKDKGHKKKKDMEPVFWSRSSERNKHGKEVIAQANKHSSAAADTNRTNSARERKTSESSSRDRPSSVGDAAFDSSKKPKKGILKKKYSGADSGCVLDDINISEYFTSDKNEKLRKRKGGSGGGGGSGRSGASSVSSSRGGSVSEGTDALNSVSDVEDGLSSFSLNLDTSDDNSSVKTTTSTSVSRNSEKSPSRNYSRALSQGAAGDERKNALTTTDIIQRRHSSHDIRKDALIADSTKVSRGGKNASTPVLRKIKGILKRNGKFSSSSSSSDRDPTWRHSLGSQSSNSSGDVLDFSYDSTDDSGLSPYNSGLPRPSWQPPAFSPPVPPDNSAFSDVAELSIYNGDSSGHLSNTDDIMNKINMLDEAYFEEGIHRSTVSADLFNPSEAQAVYKQALAICDNFS